MNSVIVCDCSNLYEWKLMTNKWVGPISTLYCISHVQTQDWPVSIWLAGCSSVQSSQVMWSPEGWYVSELDALRPASNSLNFSNQSPLPYVVPPSISPLLFAPSSWSMTLWQRDADKTTTSLAKYNVDTEISTVVDWALIYTALTGKMISDI